MCMHVQCDSSFDLVYDVPQCTAHVLLPFMCVYMHLDLTIKMTLCKLFAMVLLNPQKVLYSYM